MSEITQDTEFTYKFSFVMPVYNTADYLEETVMSILTQTMSFQQNCEIIFVNDASTDDSEKICLEFKERYPENVQYVSNKKNLGVSTARNIGVLRARGKYISFLDSDDKLTSNALAEVHRFFESNYDNIDLVSLKIETFDAARGDHPLNYKFNGVAVIDIDKNPDYIQLSGGSCFVKTITCRDHSFDTRLEIGEDMKFVTDIIMQKRSYGTVSSAKYLYRKRNNNTSAINNAEHKVSWYTLTPKHALVYLKDKYKDSNNKLHPYVQNVIAYDLQWKFRQASQYTISVEQEDIYKKTLYSLLKFIDSSVILGLRNSSPELKAYMIANIHDKNLRDIKHKDGKYYFGNTAVAGDSYGRIVLEFIKQKDDNCIVEGHFTGFKAGNDSIIAKDSCSGRNIEAEWLEDIDYRAQRFLGDKVKSPHYFRLALDSGKSYSLTFMLKNGRTCTEPKNIVTYRFFGLNAKTAKSYKILPNGNMLYKKARTLIIKNKASKLSVLKKEFIYQLRLITTPVTRVIKRTIGLHYIRHSRAVLKDIKAMIHSLKVITIRNIYFVTRPFVKKDVWLISDRITAAGDNGEAFFGYLQTVDSLEVNCYFAISKNSSDYKRISEKGKVINRDSFWYKIMFLHSSKIISSHMDDFVINPYSTNLHSYLDLYNFETVFLQHGITKDDQSEWLNRINKNIDVFVTAANAEYQSVLDGDYYYDVDSVALTGFPRYDLLNNTPNKKVILAPTWRKNLAGKTDTSTGLNEYNPDFKDSEYYKFYNDLIKDARLHSMLERLGYKMEVYMHPGLQANLMDFNLDANLITIADYPYNYKKLFAEGSVLITDYSSVFFDFAYLGKPVIYSQYDADSFFSEHIYSKGYFEYRRDGFGPVTDTVNETLDELFAILDREAMMDPKYAKRVDEFFSYRDKLNSQRLYNFIMEHNHD